MYKRQQFKFKDALTLAKLENVPQAFYLYKQRNDVLLSKLKAKEKVVQIEKNQEKPVLTEAQKEKIRKNIIKTKSLMQFHVSKNFQD